MRVLIVEDEKRLAQALGQIMEEQHYQVDIVYDGADGLDYALSGQYDIVILDVMLPKKDGFEVVHELREQKISTPVLMLTARDDISDKVQGLDCGADDYMTKPFSVSELLARVEALCRRVGRSSGGEKGSAPTAMVSGEFILDENRRLLLKAGKPIELTQVEFQIMEYFFSHPGVALARGDILKHVWGAGYTGEEKIVDVNIRRLRMKVEEEPSNPRHIVTVWGLGYRWDE